MVGDSEENDGENGDDDDDSVADIIRTRTIRANREREMVVPADDDRWIAAAEDITGEGRRAACINDRNCVYAHVPSPRYGDQKKAVGISGRGRGREFSYEATGDHVIVGSY